MYQTVLVTGGSGFVATCLIQRLLESGYTVHTTLRSLNNTAKLQPLKVLQQQYPERLKLFEADLLTPGSFNAAMQGCSVVHHVASPFLLPEKIHDGLKQVYEPALSGTVNVLQSVNQTESVGRVVMTSTVGAIFGDYADVCKMENQTLSEKYFNTTSTLENNPYHFAKVESEKAAWKICAEQKRWDLVTINPGMILGPSLVTSSESGSLLLLDEMLKGYFFYGMPNLSLTTVDVRDVAQAHINAAENSSANGRYILAAREMSSFADIARILRKYHKYPFLLPTHQIPNPVVRIIGPLFGLTQDYMSKHLGIRFSVDNHRSIVDLGIHYRPLEETLADHYRSWIRNRTGQRRQDQPTPT